MKKILYFITTSEWGGASRYVYELCRYEKEKGNKIYLVVGTKGELSNKVKRLGIRVFIISSVKRNISPINDFKSILTLRKLIKKINPDIIHLNSSKAGAIGRLACKSIKDTKAKVVFTVHGWAFTDGISSKLKKFLFRNIERMLSSLTDLFICVSNYDKKIGKRDKVLSCKSNVVVIHNGSERPQPSSINHSFHYPIRLVMVARFSEQKDQESLIKAVNELSKNTYFLTFVGTGKTLEKNKKLVSDLKLNNNIKFVGFKKDVSDILISSDVFILATHYEGLPISIIEAMSYGLPVIASDVGGNNELVQNASNGYLVNNIEEMRKAISYLISNSLEVKRMGSNSLKQYIKNFTLQKSMELTDSQYDLLVKNA